jgi:hypothetical protein
MTRWLMLVRVLSMAVVLGGGATLLADPVGAEGAQRPCDVYEQVWAWNELQADCESGECAELHSCYVDYWDHIHYSGVCFWGGDVPCSPTVIIGGQP